MSALASGPVESWAVSKGCTEDFPGLEVARQWGGFPGRPWIETPSAKDDLVPEEARERTEWSLLSHSVLHCTFMLSILAKLWLGRFVGSCMWCRCSRT